MMLTNATFEVSGAANQQRVRAWSNAYVGSGIADEVWFPENAASFHGRVRRRALQDLVLVDIEADPFGTRWDSGSPAAQFLGVAVNTRPFTERVVTGDRREFVSTSSVDIWDAATLLESEVLSPMAQTVVLVPKRALHMHGGCALLRDASLERDEASMRLLRNVLLAVAGDAQHYGPTAVSAARNCIVDLLQSVVRDRRDTSSGAVSGSMRMSVSRWVDDHLQTGPLSPADAAEHHGISVRSLHRLFADTGDSFGSLVRRRRLDRACRDLLQTDDMVQTIAMRWGYADASQFINEFKRAHGGTPAAYRKAHRTLG
jgi:AraC family transcriptional activator of tynA and feaB